jgi:hypothetical protein
MTPVLCAFIISILQCCSLFPLVLPVACFSKSFLDLSFVAFSKKLMYIPHILQVPAKLQVHVCPPAREQLEPGLWFSHTSKRASMDYTVVDWVNSVHLKSRKYTLS